MGLMIIVKKENTMSFKDFTIRATNSYAVDMLGSYPFNVNGRRWLCSSRLRLSRYHTKFITQKDQSGDV